MRSARLSGAVRFAGQLRKRAGWLCALACVGVLLMAASAGLLRGHAQASFPLPAINPPGPAAAPPGPAAARAPAAGNQNQHPTGTTPEDARKQEIANQCADLLKLATDLKTEVDKSDKDMLSVTVVRTAGEIEQLAHKVKAGSARN